MAEKRNTHTTKQNGRSAAEALDALNARARRKSDPRTLIEATIEEKAKKRRRSERPASPTFKPGT
jgi:hypothetical protein